MPATGQVCALLLCSLARQTQQLPAYVHGVHLLFFLLDLVVGSGADHHGRRGSRERVCAAAGQPYQLPARVHALAVALTPRAAGAAVSVYQVLGSEEAKHGGDHMPAMLRTHPMSSNRIKAVGEESCT